MREYEYHPAASLFPLMDGVALRALIEDVRAKGLLEPIVVHEGKVLDGRNRLRACELAGVEPMFVEWDADGVSPVEWVVSRNLKRRHLTTAQRAALALDLLPHLEAEAKERQGARTDLGNIPPRAEESGEAAEKAATLVGVGRSTVAAAKAIQKRAPEVVDAMRSGEIPTVAGAAREAGFDGLAQGSSGQAQGVSTRRDAAGRESPTTYFGKGDKWDEATKPLRRYLAAWEKRGFEYANVSPREAEKRVRLIDQLKNGLEAARADLAPRSQKAKLTV